MQDLVTRFGVIRHAETKWNREGRIQGQADSALTPKGRQDAARWGGILQTQAWHRILASDLGRALETAAVINLRLQVPVETDSRLREQDWGRWTTKTLAQIKVEERQELDRQIDAGWEFCPPEGETRLKLWQRGRHQIPDLQALEAQISAFRAAIDQITQLALVDRGRSRASYRAGQCDGFVTGAEQRAVGKG